MVTVSADAGLLPCHNPTVDRRHLIVFGNDWLDAWTEALHLLEAPLPSLDSAPPLEVRQDRLGLPMFQAGDCTSSAPGAGVSRPDTAVGR